MPTKARKRTSTNTVPKTPKRSEEASITPADVLAAGGVTDELIDPFLDDDITDYDREAFRTGIASYCRYLDSVNTDERAAAMNVPIVSTEG